MPNRSLLVFPDDTVQTLLSAIDSARVSIRIKMFVFSAPVIIDAVLRARARGVVVKVLLNPARRNGKEDNEVTRHLLLEGGILVKDSNPAFGLTHEKSMIIDDSIAFVKSLNWEMKNLTLTRDYAVITQHLHEVQEMTRCFEADWDRTSFDSSEAAYLIWCKGNGRARICRFIDEAKDTLFIQNERYQDMVIIERLVRAANRGVKVQVMARPPHNLKKEKLMEGVGGLRILSNVGVKIRKLRKLKLHGKMLLADERRAIVGSINLTPGSFDDRRELAIEVNDAGIVKRLKKIAKTDWENSRKLDLSDEGLLADLHNRLGETDGLVLSAGSLKKDKKKR